MDCSETFLNETVLDMLRLCDVFMMRYTKTLVAIDKDWLAQYMLYHQFQVFKSFSSKDGDRVTEKYFTSALFGFF